MSNLNCRIKKFNNLITCVFEYHFFVSRLNKKVHILFNLSYRSLVGIIFFI